MSRRILNNRRQGYIQKFTIGGQSFFLQTGEFEDSSLGEIFLDYPKTGSALRGFMHCFAIAVSIGLQHGVPLDRYVNAFKSYEFPPNGKVTEHPFVTEANSFIDAIFQDLEAAYVPQNQADKT